jgi:3-hydroxyacyl-CoA dehydrogenase
METVHSETVRSERHGAIGVIIVDNPPVNAIAPSVREGILAAALALGSDAAVSAVVLHCANNTFMAGADIKLLGAAPPKLTSAELMQQLEDLGKPLVAAVQGNALGGGLEFALSCHYRCTAPTANLGLPEVNLGLIPGAGGTQRLPRIVGAAKALDMIISAKTVTAAEALKIGLVNRVLAGHDVLAEAVAFAAELVARAAEPLKTRERAMAAVDEKIFGDAAQSAARTRRGEAAPLKAIEAVRAAVQLPFAQGMQLEKELFAACRDSAQSRALRHLFMAERQISKVPGIDKSTAVRDITEVGVVGAGTMGRGIAMACANAGLRVVLIETESAPLERALANIRETYEASQAKGRMNATEKQAHIDRIVGSVDLRQLASADLVIEAVFEDMAVKRQLFTDLVRICKPAAILATNTSALDIDAIAASCARPSDVIGMHFFSPANIMKLLEVVRGRATSPEVIATSMAFARRLRKLGVLAGNCDGFIGNRMLGGYRRESDYLVLDGATPQQVDGALYNFGFAMGPHAVGDLAGLDISAAGRKRRRLEGRAPSDPRFGLLGDTLVAMGRLGQKTGAGMYRYEKGSRTPLPDPEVQAMIEREAQRLGIERRVITDAEIIERCMLPLVNEGARILEEGIALRSGDIDVVYVNGYGFPRYRGGPMGYADELGLANVVASMQKLATVHGAENWTPAPLLLRLANEGRRFSDL